MPSGKNLTKNHISKVSSADSREKIESRLKLLELCESGGAELTDELLDLLESDKNLLSFEGEIAEFQLKPVSRNTVVNHKMLGRLQEARVRAWKCITHVQAEQDSPPSAPQEKQKETKATLKVDKIKLEKERDTLKSELVTLRTAYKQLLKEVRAKLPLDRDIAQIVEEHNEKSVIRQQVRLKVVK